MTSSEFSQAFYSISQGVWRAMMVRGSYGVYRPLFVAGTRIHCGMDKNAVRLALETPLRQTTFDAIRELQRQYPA